MTAPAAKPLPHFVFGLDLSVQGDVQGPFQISSPGSAGFLSGWIIPIPQAYRASPGAPAITRNCGLSTISRTSYGSSAFAFNPADLDNKNPGSLNTFQCIIQKRTARSAIGGVAYDPATQRIFPTSLSSEHQGRIL